MPNAYKQSVGRPSSFFAAFFTELIIFDSEEASKETAPFLVIGRPTHAPGGRLGDQFDFYSSLESTSFTCCCRNRLVSLPRVRLRPQRISEIARPDEKS